MPENRHVHLAIDLGAGSGRVLAGVHENGNLTLEVAHRFPNPAIETDTGIVWGIDDLWKEIRTGLKSAAEKFGADAVKSIGVDTWGVDYVLLDENNQRLAPPTNYRDPRTDGAMDEVFAKVPRDEIFRLTGVQCAPYNTLYQLHAEKRDRPELLARAKRFLLMPDYFNFLLTGVAAGERTIASTTQLLEPKGGWIPSLFEAIGVDPAIAPPLVDPGETLGSLLPAVAEETGLSPDTTVVAVGCHDTASAVAAVPAEPGTRFAYLSSGSWSLLGAELSEPIINDQSSEANFANESGVCETFRFLKNITGLWLVQECRRIWNEQGNDYSFAELAALADEAEPHTAFIDPDYPDFAERGNMPETVQAFCRRTGQPVPESPGQIMRVVSDSLALKYRYVLTTLATLVGHEFELLHVIGGGGQNKGLNQAIADSLQIPVVVGPYEATALGNILLQMLSLGELPSLSEGRALVRASESLETVEPRDQDAWNEAYERFLLVLG